MMYFYVVVVYFVVLLECVNTGEDFKMLLVKRSNFLGHDFKNIARDIGEFQPNATMKLPIISIIKEKLLYSTCQNLLCLVFIFEMHRGRFNYFH